MLIIAINMTFVKYRIERVSIKYIKSEEQEQQKRKQPETQIQKKEQTKLRKT